MVARANPMTWYSHVLKREKDAGNASREALNFEVAKKRKRGRPKNA